MAIPDVTDYEMIDENPLLKDYKPYTHGIKGAFNDFY